MPTKWTSLEIRWPSGQVDTLKDIKPNQLIFVKEGQGIVKTEPFAAPRRNRQNLHTG